MPVVTQEVAGVGSKARPGWLQSLLSTAPSCCPVPTILSLLSASDVCLANLGKSPRCWPAAYMVNEVTALNSHIPRHLQAAVTCTHVCANVLYCKPHAREERAKQPGRKQDKRDAIKTQLVCL